MTPLVLVTALGLSFVQLVSTDWLLDKHEASLERVHSIRATIETQASLDGGLTWHPMTTTRLIKSGDRERVRVALKGFPVNGVVEDRSNSQEWFNTPEGTWDLNGLDLDHPPTESVAYIDHETTGKGPLITGRISTPRERGAHGYNGSPGPTALGFVVQPLASLRAMRQSSGNVTPIQGKDGRGDPTWILRVKSKEGNFAYDVHLNPKYGYMISAWRMTGGIEADWQVEEFHEPVPGVFVAKTTRRKIKRPDLKKPMLVADTIAIADVNQPIPESDLSLNYPAGLLIYDERDQSFNIWGEGKPALKFKSQSEFLKWRNDRVADAMKARRHWWADPVTLTVLVGSALLLLALLAYRRRLVRKEHAAA